MSTPLRTGASILSSLALLLVLVTQSACGGNTKDQNPKKKEAIPNQKSPDNEPDPPLPPPKTLVDMVDEVTTETIIKKKKDAHPELPDDPPKELISSIVRNVNLVLKDIFQGGTYQETIEINGQSKPLLEVVAGALYPYDIVRGLVAHGAKVTKEILEELSFDSDCERRTFEHLVKKAEKGAVTTEVIDKVLNNRHFCNAETFKSLIDAAEASTITTQIIETVFQRQALLNAETLKLLIEAAKNSTITTQIIETVVLQHQTLCNAETLKSLIKADEDNIPNDLAWNLLCEIEEKWQKGELSNLETELGAIETVLNNVVNESKSVFRSLIQNISKDKAPKDAYAKLAATFIRTQLKSNNPNLKDLQKEVIHTFNIYERQLGSHRETIVAAFSKIGVDVTQYDYKGNPMSQE